MILMCTNNGCDGFYIFLKIQMHLLQSIFVCVYLNRYFSTVSRPIRSHPYAIDFKVQHKQSFKIAKLDFDYFQDSTCFSSRSTLSVVLVIA